MHPSDPTGDPNLSPSYPSATPTSWLTPVGRLLAAYNRVALYLRILVALILGVICGLTLWGLKPHAPAPASIMTTQPTTQAEAPASTTPATNPTTLPAMAGATPAQPPSKPADDDNAVDWIAGGLNAFAKLVLQFLSALAPPLILLAVVRALMTAKVEGRQAGYLMFLLALNTLIAIFIGLLVANVIHPGTYAHLPAEKNPSVPPNILEQLMKNIPSSLLGPLVEGNVIGVVILAVAFGLAGRHLDGRLRTLVEDATHAGFDMIITVLHWIIQLVPLAVFAKVTAVLAKDGYEPFKALLMFIVAVLVALLLQACWYLGRIWLGTWVRPMDLLRHTRDALVMAFSTGSSTATMPVTYECLRRRVGLRERSASMGALVGSNFNNDGTALYEAMAALFIAQMLKQDLTLTQQIMVVVTSVIASVGAAGIPEAGLVTMTLVFNAVHLDPAYIPLLLPVDWFLDRCRTAINVMGDMNVSCMLDGKEREGEETADQVRTGGFPVITPVQNAAETE